MNKKISTIYELKDSRILYEKKLPAFGYILLWIVTALLVAVIVWSIYTPKVDVILAEGYIESANKQYVASRYSGMLLSVEVEEGSYVDEGDVLFRIENTDWLAPEEISTITAPADGIVHLCGDYRVGTIVQSAASLVSILPVQDELMITAYVSSSDRVRIQEGDLADIAISGLPQSEYGTTSGVVETIASDATALEGGDGGFYFKVVVRMTGNNLTSNSGHTVTLSDGMTAEIRIRYDEISYFDYVLESFGFGV